MKKNILKIILCIFYVGVFGHIVSDTIYAKSIYAELVSKQNFDLIKKEEFRGDNTYIPQYFKIKNNKLSNTYYGIINITSGESSKIQKIKLEKGYILNYDGDKANIWITYVNTKNKTIHSNKIKLKLMPRYFSYHEVVQYKDNKMIINLGGYHEGEGYELYYDPKKNKLIDIRSDIYKPLMGKKGLDRHIYDVKIRGDKMIFREYLYCCDIISDPNGNEEITIDLNKNKIIKKIKVKNTKIRDGSWNN